MSSLRRRWWVDPPARGDREPPIVESKTRAAGETAPGRDYDGIGNRSALTLFRSGRRPPARAAYATALDPATRALMESRFGESFADVRIHADAGAAAMADGLDARAFTSGGDITFGAGEYSPDTAEGRQLLAHELAHVVQQRRGGDGPPSAATERDAERASHSVAAGKGAKVSERAKPGGIQRQPKGGATLDLPEALRVELERQGLAQPAPDGPVIVGDLDPELAVRASELFNPRKRPAAPTLDRLRLPFLPSPAGPPLDFTVPPASPLSLFAPPPPRATQAHTAPSRPAPPAVRKAPSQPSDEAFSHWARDFGAVDLDHDDIVWPSFGAKPKDPFLAEQEAARARALREVLRKQIEQGLTLTASAARSHFRSRGEFDRFTAEFISIAHEISEEKGRAAEAELAKIEASLFSTEADILTQRAHDQMTHQRVGDQIELMKVHTPEVMKPRTAAMEVLILEAKAVDTVADVIPYVGQLKMLIEAASGRTISGQIDLAIKTGAPFSQLPQDLDIDDRLIRLIPFAIEGAAKIVGRAPGWIASLSRLRAITQLGDAELNLLLREMASLQGKERQIVEALLKARQARRAVAFGARQAFTAPAYMFMSAGGIGAVPMRVARPIAKAASGVELVLEADAGLNPNDVRRKAEALNDLCQRKEVTKVKSPPRQLVSGGTGEAYRGMPVSVPTEYKHRLLEIAHKRFGPTSANYEPDRWQKFFDLWKSQSGDHVVDLQLSGADDIGNIWLFDAETNSALGRQIQQQLRNLPDGTRITGVRWRFPAK